ncbi:hypothetical protein FDP41_000255 [Naegleria fowleri]|uniref:F-box domain-containing protein n=1 Tax=Naegleria fowleri TaxID=5763 RepID=A0A6A5CBW9_NAEFO|nr:uncharacterized protein FDP41_000255 [Naegleria fowleri]KAF0985216.1 hypothetical protein FDP41_000255 [Naegleria fowleri]
MFQQLPNEIIFEIFNFLPCRFLFDYRMMDVWHRVLYSSPLLPFSRNDTKNDHSLDYSLFKNILIERLNRKEFLWRYYQVSHLQMVFVLFEVCLNHFGRWIRHFNGFYHLLGIPQEMLHVMEDQLQISTLMTTRASVRAIEEIERNFNANEGWSYQELSFLFEFISRNNYLLLMDKAEKTLPSYTSDEDGYEKRPNIEISWAIVNDVTHFTHLESFIFQSLLMDEGCQLLNHVWNSIQPCSTSSCIRLRGQLIWRNGKYSLNLYHPHFCSKLLSNKTTELESELFEQMLGLLRDKSCFNVAVKELLLQRYWFPAMDGGSIWCETKNQRAWSSIENYLGITIEERYHPFVKECLSTILCTTSNLDAPQLSIHKYEMTIFPQSRKVKFRIIPKKIPPVVVSLFFKLLLYGVLDFHTGIFTWTFTRWCWNSSSLSFGIKVPIIILGAFFETSITGLCASFLSHALLCAAVSTIFSTLEYEADVKFSGSLSHEENNNNDDDK